MTRIGMISAILGISLVLAVPTGCRRAERAAGLDAPPAGMLDRQWILVSLDGERVELEDEERRPHLTLQSEENHMTGYTGCNRMFGAYEIQGDLLSFGSIGATEMACAETAELEPDFLKAMEATASYYFAEPDLEFFDENGRNVASFVSSGGTS